jgi:hypothetical protein
VQAYGHVVQNLVESMPAKLPPKPGRGERPARCSGHKNIRSELRKAQGQDGLSAITVAPVKAESELEPIASGAACPDHVQRRTVARLNLKQP